MPSPDVFEWVIDVGGLTLASVVFFGGTLFLVRWFLKWNNRFPTESFPVLAQDRVCGILVGVVLAVVWIAIDFLLHWTWQRPLWNAHDWQVRIVMMTMLLLSGDLTWTGVFRIIRCRKERASKSGPS